ncbi:solute carrier family 15 [Vigna unguiculata]|uniref:Solute carrier family 15 n=1 Tax=Vigna unguiculata TaxID=3917 RepID=A0A4D6NFN6_VIGUN|nr:solute carrier family 15 [Vigna unguiculata]
MVTEGDSSYIEESVMERRSRADEKKIGGAKVASLLLVNRALATLAFFGVGVNLVLFLTRVLGQDNVSAANNVSKWIGTVYMFSLIGAFLSDSYWGRYLTCTVFQLVFVLVYGQGTSRDGTTTERGNRDNATEMKRRRQRRRRWRNGVMEMARRRYGDGATEMEGHDGDGTTRRRRDSATEIAARDGWLRFSIG